MRYPAQQKTADTLSKNIKAFANPTAKEAIYEDILMLLSRDVLTLIKKNKS